MDDSNIYNVAELGIGLNPCSENTGSMMEDEGAFSACNISIGDNTSFGGLVKAKSHIDLIMRDSTITIDNELLQKDGKLETRKMINR
jgi:leucyl aminopeptidase (aminopeptidase T)